MKQKQLRFVVQQHKATHMHWDFRLEMDNVLVSWALPKGPSTDPSVRRLGIRVVDHVLSYKDFEGVIKGDSYGAGQVIIWDEGTYEPVNFTGENLYDEWLPGGTLELRLHGHKLKGLWNLFKTKGRRFGQDSWLLVKKKDEFACLGEIVQEQPYSVRSGKRVEQVTGEDGCLNGDEF